MRQKFIQASKKSEAKKECPWACLVIKVDGGYMCFESPVDYELWKNQK